VINKGPDGKPILDAKKLPMIGKAVMAACDAKDGLADGILQDPRACTWDPGAIVCKTGAKGDDCLTAAEADVVRKIYSGAVNSKGKKLYWGMQRGSEYYWSPVFINSGRLGTRADTLGMAYAFYNEPSPTFSEFDYDRDPPRLAMLEPLFDARNPDLRPLKDHGAKLILYHGWNDNEIPPETTVDYYETATRTLGGPAATMDFFRMFMIPGMGHCRRGPGGDAIDWITALENWVEKGQAPEKMIVGHLKQEQTYNGLPRLRYPVDPARIDRTRPVYPYPTVAKWSGTGDSNDAATWEPVK
jgi:feruloyl esterase